MNSFPHAEKTNGTVEFSQPYPVALADALLEIGTDVILAVFWFDEHLPKQTLSALRNVVPSATVVFRAFFKDTHY
jgi:hypothetical protein